MKIYIVKRNSDSTEGRGPMVVDSVWLSREKANDYIDDQPGVMGVRQKWSHMPYGDWTVTEIETRD